MDDAFFLIVLGAFASLYAGLSSACPKVSGVKRCAALGWGSGTRLSRRQRGLPGIIVRNERRTRRCRESHTHVELLKRTTADDPFPLSPCKFAPTLSNFDQ